MIGNGRIVLDIMTNHKMARMSTHRNLSALCWYSKWRNNYGFILHYILIFSFFIVCLVRCSSSTNKVTGKRIVSLVPSVTEIIYALGRDSLLVGNTIYCDYPEPAKKIYKVGDFSNPSLEKILKRKPTLVCATLPEQKNIVEQLKRYKIPVFCSKPSSIDNLFQEMIAISKLVDAEEQGKILVSALKNRLIEIANKHNIIDSPKVYIEIAGTPIMTIGNLSYINDLVRYAGAINVFADVSREYFVTNSEELIKRNPDIILILHPSATKSQIRKRVGWSQISAIKKNRIYAELNPDYFFRPGPRFILAVEELAKIVYSTSKKRK
ncbi:MAG: cobalamin-binding protein [candidate division WOR-3 bacterium]|nr:cobalamin-binding protein [candidate division WOR-3 bacterium]